MEFSLNGTQEIAGSSRFTVMATILSLNSANSIKTFKGNSIRVYIRIYKDIQGSSKCQSCKQYQVLSQGGIRVKHKRFQVQTPLEVTILLNLFCFSLCKPLLPTIVNFV